jgi:hypothetical protein
MAPCVTRPRIKETVFHIWRVDRSILNRERVGPSGFGGQQDLSVLHRAPGLTGYCEHDNEISYYINGPEFLDKLSDNSLFSKQLEENLYRDQFGQPVAISDP